MAPPVPTQTRDHTHQHPIMSSPNIHALRRSLANAQQNATEHDLSSMKTVYVGKHKHPVTIMAMAPVTAPSWQKKSCFASLRSNALDLANGNHNMADVINLLMEDLPCSATAAFQESKLVSTSVDSAILDIANLEPEAVLDSMGLEVTVDPFGDKYLQITGKNYRSYVEIVAYFHQP